MSPKYLVQFNWGKKKNNNYISGKGSKNEQLRQYGYLNLNIPLELIVFNGPKQNLPNTCENVLKVDN